MTNREKLNQMSTEELAVWLDEHDDIGYDNAPWIRWFNKKYCQHCKAIVSTSLNGAWETEASYCEVNDKCSYFSDLNKIPSNLEIIKMWLEAEFTT